MIGIHWYNTSNNQIWNFGMSYECVCSTIVVTIGGEPPLTARERLRICGTLFRCLCTRPGSGLLVELRVSAKMVVYHELIWYVSVNVRYWYGMYAKKVSDVLAYDGQQWSNRHVRNMATPIVFIFFELHFKWWMFENTLAARFVAGRGVSTSRIALDLLEITM